MSGPDATPAGDATELPDSPQPGADETDGPYPTDKDLIVEVRGGSMNAYGLLYARHYGAALRIARRLCPGLAEAEDVASEAFIRILTMLRAGQGPETAFRAYLRRAVRNVAFDWFKKDKRLEFTDDIEAHAGREPFPDQVEAVFEQTLAVRAFAMLPERWRLVLWYTTVQEQPPDVVAHALGVNANAVTSLAYRAREGLRSAYLQAYIGDRVSEECQPTASLLGAYTRRRLGARDRVRVVTHLAGCARCRALCRELADVNPNALERSLHRVEPRPAAVNMLERRRVA